MAHSTYVQGADGQWFRLCRIKSSGAAPDPSNLRIPAFFRLPLTPARRAAVRSRRVRPRWRPVPVSSRFQGRFDRRRSPLPSPWSLRGRFVILRRALWRHTWPAATNKGRPRRPMFHTGRRLMRQTVPTESDGQFATLRSQTPVRLVSPWGSRSHRREMLRFGLPLTPESGGPSRHPAAPSAPTVKCARRRQEFQYAQQDVDRCHSPGRDPGRRGPRQSRRRI